MNLKKLSLIPFLLLCSQLVFSQQVFTKNGSVSFFSKAPLENISAESAQLMSVLNQNTGELQFSVLIKSFHFKKSLMETHFNENYLESDRFPKATFKGKITDMASVDFTKDGTYAVTVSGDLNIHGITNKISTTGTIIIKSGSISAAATFKVKPAEYRISIPNLVKDNIAEIIDVKVSCLYDQKM